jgi:signal transduction histidine kinase
MSPSEAGGGAKAPDEESGTQRLRPKARLIRAIGDQLISSETVAVLELVKNAYDADARCVLVRFVPPLELGAGKVQIIDDGHGMSVETLRGAWMEPATDWKRDRPRSEKFDRRVLGEKGLGRFAAARIADHFYVTSRRKGENSETRVLLDWTEFDHKDRYLDEVQVLWEVTSPKEILPFGPIEGVLRRADLVEAGSYDHGTVLSLELLRQAWTPDDFRGLQRALSRLVSPFDRDISGGFSIFIEAPKEFGDFSGRVGPPEVFEHPHYLLDGTIQADGSCCLKVGTPTVLQTVEKRFVLKGERLPTCGAFDIKLRVWNRDSDSVRLLADELRVGVQDVRRDIDAIGGVNIYRDGFRILPYGEYGNDWIGLDSRRVQNPTLRLSNNQVSGYVFISAERNPLLVDQSNREGLFEHQATRDLRELLMSAIAEIENARYDERPRRIKPQADEGHQAGLFDGFDLSPVRLVASERHPQDQELAKVIDENQRRLTANVERVKTVLSRYQRLATLGSLVDMVLHEGRQPVSSIRYDVDDIRTRLERAPVEALPHLVAGILEDLKAIDKSADLLSAIFKKLDPFSGRQRGRPRGIILEDAIRDGVALVEKEISEVGAAVTLPGSRTDVRVDPADIQMIIKNLVDNSLHWLRHVPKGQRKIAIEVNRPSDGIVELLISDSGPGIADEDRDRIWSPYFTRKPDGVGLGLAIIGEIIQDVYGGEFNLIDGPLSGATFRVTLKRRVG